MLLLLLLRAERCGAAPRGLEEVADVYVRRPVLRVCL